MLRIKLVSANISNYFETNKIEKATTVPATGAHTKGDLVINIGVDANTRPMWVCTETGTPGKWAPVNTGSTYTHPASHPASMITQDDTHRFVTDAEKTKWNSVGDKSQLQTTNKNDLVSAINELFQSANNGKSTIATVIGSPLDANDTFSAMGNKLQGIKSKLKKNLDDKNVNTNNTTTLNGLVDLVASIKSNKFPEWYNDNVWINAKEMPTGRSDLTASVVNNKIHCIGGTTEYGTGSTNMHECYDPVTNMWENRTYMPTARIYLTSSTVDGKIYCIGGVASNNGGDSFRSNECYDPVTNTWTSKKPIPYIGRGWLTSGVVDNKIHCIGGIINNSPTDKNECYDHKLDVWSTKANMLTSRSSLTSSVIDNKIYCIGGDGNGTDKSLSKNECYDPITNTWSIKAEIISGRSFLSSCTVNNKIYCIGGILNDAITGNDYTDRNECYDPKTDRWTIESRLPDDRANFVACAVDGKIFCMGGDSLAFSCTKKNNCYIL